MGRLFNVCHLVLLAVLVSSIGISPGLAAVPKTSDGLLDRDPGPATDSLEIGTVKPLPEARPPADIVRPRGNPLWSVPLSTLTATQERPIFSASRRPPPRAVLAPSVEQVALPVAAKATVPEPASMQLLGAVVGDKDAIAILMDQATREVIRMRVGEDRRGWTLSSLQNREATMRKDDQTEILVLQRPGDQRAPPAPAGVPPSPVAEGVVSPALVSGVDNSFAPFIPRSTPKNGEPDGL